ncbi:TSUP family transporter [Salinarimonas soli]|uniref:Probable membrane transporter protein n=1 Tax=Salinarimonas soli TaxID=1638099 RepID=A0A5B2VE80_9HYPH|nr:TSUP family transporter [Salinarimonas soli]KAA2236740.1 TSUP family transporter [Salinarimonas soli]
MAGIEFETIALLFGVALLAGCFDAIAGGGGLITVPALLLAGLDPVAAIATNKVQGAAGTLSAAATFARKGLLIPRIAVPGAVMGALGGVAGALCVGLLSRPVLEALVPVLLVTIALYFGTARRMGDADARARMGMPLFLGLVVPVIGFYDGVFGPGAGSFYMAGFVGLLGFGVLKATAHTKIVNAASNLGSLALFALTGAVVWPVGIAMGVGSFLGAQIGSRLAMRHGAVLIRPLLVLISCAMAARLLWDPANPLRRALAGLLASG